MRDVAFIGVGSIGAPMARCVLQAGFDVIVFDKNPDALKPFVDVGTPIADSIAACADRDMIIIMVANDRQVREVTEELLASVSNNHPPHVAVMSTVMPQTIKDVADACAEKGVHLIDAPVSGLPKVAEQGKLTIMVGGDAADHEVMRPVLETMGKNIFHTGELGTGEVTKLVNNIIGVSNLFLTVEAMSVAKKHGMNLQKLADIIEMSSGRNFSTQDWERGKATFSYFAKSLDLSKVAVDLSRKDLHHALELANQADVSCPLLNRIANTVDQLSYEYVKESWGAME